MEIKLDEKDMGVFNQSEACKIACEKLTKDAIKHYELQIIEERAIWKVLSEKYNLDLNKYTFVYDNANNTLIGTEYDEVNSTVAEYTRKKAVSNGIEGYIRGKLGVKK